MAERPLRNEAGQTLEEFLAAYRPGDYERPCVTIDLCVFSVLEGEIQILLVRRKNHPWIGCRALPGGFVEPGETTREAAVREIEEECSLTGLDPFEIGFFSDPNRDPRAWIMSCAYAVAADRKTLPVQAADDAAAADWFTITCDRTDCGEKEGYFMLTLSLVHEDERLSARMEVECVKTIFGTEYRFHSYEADGIACDHGKIIAQALLKGGL